MAVPALADLRHAAGHTDCFISSQLGDDMRNAITMNASRGWRAPSTLAALSLAAFLAAGCTTNKVPGNGQPSSSPEIGSAGTAATPGSSSGTSGTPTTPANPPMISTSADAGAAATPVIEP